SSDNGYFFVRRKSETAPNAFSLTLSKIGASDQAALMIDGLAGAPYLADRDQHGNIAVAMTVRSEIDPNSLRPQIEIRDASAALIFRESINDVVLHTTAGSLRFALDGESLTCITGTREIQLVTTK